MTDTRAPAPSDATTTPRPGWALFVLAVSQLMIVLDGTIVNVALPTAQRDLGFASDQRQWVVTAYALAFGALLLLGGRLTDVLGRRRLFIVGLVGFALSSVIGGAAPNFGTLVAGRAAQGAFGALLAPAALSLLAALFTAPKQRAKAFGVFGAVAGGGAAIGLVLGGLLTEYTSWRWTLFINLFFAAAAVIGALLTIPASTSRAPRPSIDVPGAVLVSVGLAGLVYGLSSAESTGWTSPITISSIAGGIVFLVAFVIVESRTRQPLLPLRVVLDRSRGGAFLTTGIVSLALFSVFLFLTYYLQALRGYTPLLTGVAFLPLPISIAVTSIVIAPRSLARFGPKVLLVTGPLLAAAALLILSTISLHSNYWFTIVPALVVLGLGMGHVFSASPNIATSNLDPGDLGVGSAMVNTTQQVGGAIGTALLSVIATTTVSRYLADHGTGATAQQLAQLASYQTAYLAAVGIIVALSVTTSILIRNTGRAGATAKP
ncbi:DHA2 family efflux MFS transporter permease subunit [Curtobacterium sp. VKM Ac-1395]|uniref:DHA2 family efflux MFS transporter permease subunit n=1 Tax=Curtobacterium sp. VKM Ac-1395 TaxID=2783815 RepID=UPI00188AA718|nr:DHA2 family efflux MFS transporter permease subunit [Curtobacterium sp. VKM Ac-1395]MBF4591721.1 DHA2 family efflux MFS transporter permease subunit [Curtobacterium sp. VKM Ac-1395]